MKKKCNKCKKLLNFSSFYKCKISKSGYTYSCKKCVQTEARRIRREKKLGIFIRKFKHHGFSGKKLKLHRKKYGKIYRKIRYKELNIKKKIYNENIKKEGIKKYGGKCSCCGEKTYEFLTLEHLKGRKKEKGKRKTGKKAWMMVKSQGYPKSYTVLCFNCNCAKGAYGKCPHQRKIH